MGNKIIVAGLGHGGIVTAAILAKHGYDVTVYEKKSEGTLGHDWTDIFAPKSLNYAGIPMPESDKYELKEDMVFYSPSLGVRLKQHIPDNEKEIKMERKDIYAHLISYAADCGVRIVYDCAVLGPVMLGNRVAGIKTEKGDFYADLVIDSCGIDSPVRKNLPACVPVDKDVSATDRIYVYRAFYNKASDEPTDDKFKLILFFNNKKGINWVASEDEYTDVLIGRFEPFGMDEVEKTLTELRKTNPRLGTEVVRGGQFVQIPIRQPLSVMVWDGYAVIGDAACMTVPLIGSGMANCFKAGKILAEAIMDDINDEFDRYTLWKYQVNYYKEVGGGLAPIAAAKNLLVGLEPKVIDAFFESGAITEDDINISAEFGDIGDMLKFDTNDLITKVKAVAADKELTKKALKCGAQIGAVGTLCMTMPKSYSRDAVASWAKKYNNIFK
ncbi:MAG: NAD(P)/FAD-dependent oxidoreductase [Clostridia bacterium]|nr:NAD(P)/FAD-dependent oxidoreductase [Clostridia bacterium]